MLNSFEKKKKCSHLGDTLSLLGFSRKSTRSDKKIVALECSQLMKNQLYSKTGGERPGILSFMELHLSFNLGHYFVDFTIVL